MPLDLGKMPQAEPDLVCHRDKKPCTKTRCPLWDEGAETCWDRHLLEQQTAREEQLANLLGGLEQSAPALLALFGQGEFSKFFGAGAVSAGDEEPRE